jgi:hypothetical protein
MSKPTVTMPPWRTKPPERVRRIEIKARSKDRAFCLLRARTQEATESAASGGFKRQGLFQKQRRPNICCPFGGEPDSEHQGRPTNGRSRSVMLATSVQKLLASMKRRKFSMPRSLFAAIPFAWEGDV